MYYAIRNTDTKHEIGDIFPRSYVYEDGNKTETELRGTCAYGLISKQIWGGIVDEYEIDEVPEEYIMEIARKIQNIYCGKHCYLVRGEIVEFGEDDGEVIMEDCEVVRMLF